MTPLLLTVFTVIVVSALCSLAEAALYSVPASHVEKLVSRGRRTGRLLARLRADVDKPITAILSLNTIANTTGAALAGALAAEVLSERAVLGFSVLFTLGILVFSEVIPKTIGVVYTRQLAVWIARPLHLLVLALSPIVWLCGRLTRLVSGSRVHRHVSGEELMLMARLGIREGAISEYEGRVIENILSLRDKTVAQVMTPRTVVLALDAATTVAEATADPRLHGVSRVPVYFGSLDEVGGVVLRHRLLHAVAEGELERPIGELMRPVHFLLDQTRLTVALARFLERHEHLFVVLDEYGGLAGVVTLEDVMEEILGKEIVDELDRVVDMRELALRRRREVLQMIDGIHAPES